MWRYFYNARLPKVILVLTANFCAVLETNSIKTFLSVATNAGNKERPLMEVGPDWLFWQHRLGLLNCKPGNFC